MASQIFSVESFGHHFSQIPKIAMILKPDSIKTIEPHGRLLTFNNFDLNSTNSDLIVKEGRKSKSLPITISLKEGDVSGYIFYNLDKKKMFINFLIHDVKKLDYVDYELTAQDAKSRNFNPIGRVTAENDVLGYTG